MVSDGSGEVEVGDREFVRAGGPEVDLEALNAYARTQGLGRILSVTPLRGGHSNLTWRLEIEGGSPMVLRQPPLPPVPPGAHDIVREARLLRMLFSSDVPVPEVLAICDDHSVLGTDFSLIDFVPGETIGTEVPVALAAHPDRAALAFAFVDAIAAVHAVDLTATGLAGIARPDGYLQRQLRTFSKLWVHNRTRELPAMAELGEWLVRNRPEAHETTLVHGDARLGNALVDPGPPPRITALLDWEMSTLGDPLADVAYMLITWSDPSDTLRPAFHLSTATGAPGFPTRDQLIERYVTRTGREFSDREWYLAFAYWKSAIFMEGNVRRAASGASDDELLLGFADGVEELAELGVAAGPRGRPRTS